MESSSQHDRLVVVLCGPPGSGKTTIARQSGLDVYDQDDLQWTSVKAFNEALAALRTTPTARAVVTRFCATSSARHKAASLVGATHVYLIDPGQDTCIGRVKGRGRDAWRGEVQGVLRWYTTHDLADRVRLFPGWADLDPPSAPPPPPRPPTRTKATPASRGYGAAHKAERRRWKTIVDSGRAVCARCGKPIAAGSAWDLGHSDDRSRWTGPEHASCNRRAGGRNGARVTNERATMTRRSWF